MTTRQEIKAPKPFMLIGFVLIFSGIAMAAFGLTSHMDMVLYVASIDVLAGVIFLVIGARRDRQSGG